MFVDYDTGKPPGMRAPLDRCGREPEEKYVDFKAYPDQIPRVLPDFKPWSHYPAI
jgi:hypothetical protein